MKEMLRVDAGDGEPAIGILEGYGINAEILPAPVAAPARVDDAMTLLREIVAQADEFCERSGNPINDLHLRAKALLSTPPSPQRVVDEKFASELARHIFSIGDEPKELGGFANRLQYMCGKYPDGEVARGGLCEKALAEIIRGFIKDNLPATTTKGASEQ